MAWPQWFSALWSKRTAEDIKEDLVHHEPTAGYRGNSQASALIAEMDDLPFFTLWRARMMLRDPVVTFGLAVRNALLFAAEIEVTSKTAGVAAYVGKLYSSIWEKHAPRIVETKQWGFGGYQLLFKDSAGMLEIDGLKDFDPYDIRAEEFAGQICGMEVKGNSNTGAAANTKQRKLFAPRALWTTYESRAGNAYGSPILRRAYGPWWEKWMQHGAKQVIRKRMIKDAYRGDMVRVPMDKKVVLPNGTELSWRQVGQEIVENILAGGTLVLPKVLDRDGRDLVDYTQAKDTGNPEGIWRWNEEVNHDIWLGLEVPKEIIEAASTGSGYSGRSIPFVVALSMAAIEFSEYLKCMDRDTFRPLVALQFGLNVSYEVKPKDLIESYAKKLGGSQMGGSSMGGSGPQQPPPDGGQPARMPPQIPSGGGNSQRPAQFSEPAQFAEGPSPDPFADAALQNAAEYLAKVLREMTRNVPDNLGPESLDTLLGKLDNLLAKYTPEITKELTDAQLAAMLAAHAHVAEQIAKTGHEAAAAAQLPAAAPPALISEFSPGSAFIRFPVVEDALETLRTSPVFAGETWRETAEAVKQGAFGITADLRAETLSKVREALTEQLEDGLSRAEFVEKAHEIIGKGLLSDSHLAQVFRNNVGQSLADARERALSAPLVVDAFPYRKRVAAHDNRVRPEHRALETQGLNGTDIYRADDPAWQALRAPFAWNCRCDDIPLGLVDAARAGVREASEWLKRAEAMAEEKGGSRALYFAETAPTTPEFVPWPTFEGQRILPAEGWERNSAAFDEGEAHEFSSTQFNLPSDIAFRITQLGQRIADEDLAPDGREDKPHVTVKFGLHTNDAEEVRAVVQNEAPIAIQFGKASIFDATAYDVVKIDIISEGIRRLNEIIGDSLECTDTHPTYQPHVTIAYVKKGLGEKYAAKLNDLEGEAVAFNRVVFSDKNRQHISIPLLGVSQFDEGAGKWITIGGKPEGDKKHKGGFPVQISSEGVILKGGPKALRGKHVSQVAEHFDTERKTRREAGEKDAFGKVGDFFDKAAKKSRRELDAYERKAPGISTDFDKIAEYQGHQWGIPAKDYAELARSLYPDIHAHISERNDARAYASSRLKVWKSTVSQMENKAGKYGQKAKGRTDYTEGGFAEVGRELARLYPSLGWGRGYDSQDIGPGDEPDYARLTWELIKEEKQNPSMVSREFHGKVDEYLENHFKQATAAHGKPSPIDLEEYDPDQFAEGTHHAPAGGITIGGTFYTGGQFIPGEVVAKATKEERAQLEHKAAEFEIHGLSLHEAATLAARHGHEYDDAKAKIEKYPGRWAEAIKGYKEAEAAEKKQKGRDTREKNWKPNELQQEALDLAAKHQIVSPSLDVLMGDRLRPATEALIKRGILERVDAGREISYRLLDKPGDKAAEPHTLTRAEYHKQEKDKPGYEPQATNKAYWGHVREALEAGKEVPEHVKEHYAEVMGGLPEVKKEPLTPKVKSEVSDKPDEPAKAEEAPAVDMEAHKAELLRKAAAYDAKKQGATITDVTPAGYGPSEPEAAPFTLTNKTETAKPKFEEKGEGRQDMLFGTKGVPGERNLFAAPGVPDEDVYKPKPKAEPTHKTTETTPKQRQRIEDTLSSAAKAAGKQVFAATGKLPHELTLDEYSAVIDPENAKWRQGQKPEDVHKEWVKAADIHAPDTVHIGALEMYAGNDEPSLLNNLNDRRATAKQKAPE